MITHAEIEKLGALHVVQPAMLSLYLAAPPPADLAARAGELIAAAEAACGQPMAEQDRSWVLQRLPPCARDGPGRTVAVFACAGTGLLEVIPRDGLVAGYECGRCGALSLDADECCPDWGTAALPVSDLIEEMVSRVLEDGGEVTVTTDCSSPVA